MSVRLKVRGSNQTVLQIGDDAEILFSYETPVAGRHPRLGLVRSLEKYSQTTTRHVNDYCGAASATMVPARFFEEWLVGIGDVEQAAAIGRAIIRAGVPEVSRS